MAHVLVLIRPAMASARLPGKPLADIAGEPMIVHVMRRRRPRRSVRWWLRPIPRRSRRAWRRPGAGGDDARRSRLGLRPHFRGFAGGRRGWARGHHRQLQGDLPTLAPSDVAAAIVPLADPAVDIGTLAAEIKRTDERNNPNVVKVVGTPIAAGSCARSISPARRRHSAMARSIITSGSTPIVAPRSPVLSPAPSPLEQREKLEQLRALEAGMRIDVSIVDSVPLGVDTPEDLERARDMLAR